MKLAIVSIEDKRFAEHNGVDWQGTLTGLAGYASGDTETRGGSTIEQQYVKNYQLLVTAQTDAERRFEDLATDGIEDDACAFTRGDLLNAGHQVFLLGNDHMIRPCFEELGFLG